MSRDNVYGSISKKIGPQGYLKWVNQIVHAHRGSFITNFRVYFNFEWTNNISQVEKWVRFALSKRVENLDRYETSIRKFCLGLDILKDPPCYKGVVNLKSLRLSSLEVSGETLEFILSQCHLLEQLYVYRSTTLHTLNIVSDQLKQLSLLACSDLKELEIDAVNLISFRYESVRYCTDSLRICMVFKSVPKLVEMSFAGNGCRYPFPVLRQISNLHNQLTSLYFSPIIYATDFHGKRLKGCRKIDMQFPNVTQLTYTICFPSRVVFQLVKLLKNACPMLHQLNIQIEENTSKLREEAKQLREIELENERMDELSKDQNSNAWAQKVQAVNHVARVEYANKNPNLKVLEYWECEPSVLIIDNIGTRARRLAKVVPPNVHVGVRYKSGLFRFPEFTRCISMLYEYL